MNLDDVRRLEASVRANPDALASLSEQQQLSAAQQIIALRDAEYAKSAWVWASEQVMTKDEASAEVRPWPADKVYLHDLFDAMEASPKLAVAKSRRMFVSWAVATFLTHRIRYRKHYAGFVQSATEDKSAFIVDQRMKFIEDNLPQIYRREYTANKTVQGKVGTITYTRTGSYGKAIAQGGDAFRAYTPTFVFMDEIEFMERGHESFVSVLPFSEKNCQIILASSSNGPHGVLADMARSAGFVRF